MEKTIQEQWTRWEPIPGLANKYYIEMINNNYDGLTITLVDVSSEMRKAQIIFDGWLIGYRWADETYMDHRVQELFRIYGSEFLCKWTLFKVVNSEYSKYISETSGSISDHTPFTHFALFTGESIFEILATYEPEVKIVNLS